MPELIVPEDQRGHRLDIWLSTQQPELSRARWQSLLKEGLVLVNGAAQKANYTTRTGDKISYTIPEAKPTELIAENIPLTIIYEDADILVMNKPAGIVVHPAPGHASGTLVNALIHHCKDLAGIGGELRPGIVHRLDKDTSGLLVIAKNEAAMKNLVDQFKHRNVKKEYLALIWGCPKPERGTIKTLIGRSETNRKKMSAKVKHGREAVTHYEVIEKMESASLVRLRIETGRTHQIRVHMAFKNHPVVGDTLYGRARSFEATRQMLHAAELRFNHPRTGKELVFSALMPDDMLTACNALRSSQ